MVLLGKLIDELIRIENRYGDTMEVVIKIVDAGCSYKVGCIGVNCVQNVVTLADSASGVVDDIIDDAIDKAIITREKPNAQAAIGSDAEDESERRISLHLGINQQCKKDVDYTL